MFAAAQKVRLVPLCALSSPSILLILNTATDCNCLDVGLPKYWQQSTAKYCCDGAANKLRDLKLIPDVISGDFDSITRETLDYFRSLGSVRIEHTPDQSATDFTKALGIIANDLKQKHLFDPKPQSIIVIGCLGGGGRFDHVLGLLHSLYLFEGQLPLPIFIVHKRSLVTLISAGTSVIELPDQSLLNASCGLIPIGAPAHVSTKGFRWDLSAQKLDFKGLISTCNEVSHPRLDITTDETLCFTMDLTD